VSTYLLLGAGSANEPASLSSSLTVDALRDNANAEEKKKFRELQKCLYLPKLSSRVSQSSRNFMSYTYLF